MYVFELSFCIVSVLFQYMYITSALSHIVQSVLNVCEWTSNVPPTTAETHIACKYIFFNFDFNITLYFYSPYCNYSDTSIIKRANKLIFIWKTNVLNENSVFTSLRLLYEFRDDFLSDWISSNNFLPTKNTKWMASDYSVCF